MIRGITSSNALVRQQAESALPWHVDPTLSIDPMMHSLCRASLPVTEPSPQTPRPKNPLNAYNLFFQVERKRILTALEHGNEEVEGAITAEEIRLASLEHKRRGKRLHRKTHGKIGFSQLARTVAQRWKKLDKKTRKLLQHQALLEKQDHAEALRKWEEKEGYHRPSQQQDAQQEHVAVPQYPQGGFALETNGLNAEPIRSWWNDEGEKVTSDCCHTQPVPKPNLAQSSCFPDPGLCLHSDPSNSRQWDLRVLLSLHYPLTPPPPQQPQQHQVTAPNQPMEAKPGLHRILDDLFAVIEPDEMDKMFMDDEKEDAVNNIKC